VRDKLPLSYSDDTTLYLHIIDEIIFTVFAFDRLLKPSSLIDMTHDGKLRTTNTSSQVQCIGLRTL